MAKRPTFIITSDLTEEVIPDGQHEEVTFSVNGAGYKMDLTKAEAQKFYDLMSTYTEAAQDSPIVRGSSPKKIDSDAKTIRAWAASNGVDCPKRGRIPAEVKALYEAR